MDIVCVSPSTIRDCAGDAGSLSLLSWLALTTDVGRVARTAGEPGCVDPGRRSPRMLLMRLSTSALRSRSWLRRGVGDSTCVACQCCCRVNNSGPAHFSQGARSGGLSAGASLFSPELTLSLQLGELGLLCEDFRAALLERGLHSGGGAECGVCSRIVL